MEQVELLLGDSRERLKELADVSVDAVVTDPPYELGFMGKAWDASGVAYDVKLWREVLRVLKPGGHLLAFGGTRTYHRMACAIEDAGFEIRDSIHWMYGSGFSKSLNISKAIDKAAGVPFKAMPAGGVGFMNPEGSDGYNITKNQLIRSGESTDAARQWAGFGTALKPAHEPIVVARKPLAGTVAANVLAHGVGGINVDGCRVAHASEADFAKHAAGVAALKARGGSLGDSWKNSSDLSGANDVSRAGRWPPNVVFSHLPECSVEECVDGCAVADLDVQSGVSKPKPRREGRMGGSRDGLGMGRGGDAVGVWPEDPGGGASRFFPAFRYQAKAGRKERRVEGVSAQHPTQKPVALMQWLVRLVTPPNGLVLDPFTGSGTTGVAAVLENARFVGIEMSEEYMAIARARIDDARARPCPK